METSFGTSSLRVAGAIGLFLISVLIPGCTKSVNPASDSGALSDPSIKPEVIFTMPGNGATGPFDVYNRGDGINKPSFVVQFNKLMSSYSVGISAVRVTGFDRPALAVPHVTSNVPILPGSTAHSKTSEIVPQSVGGVHGKNKASAYDDVLEFDIVDSLFYATGNGYHQMMPYALGKTYTVTIDTPLTDINGNHLQSSYTFSFTPEPKFRVVTTDPPAGQKDFGIYQQNPFSILFNSPLNASALTRISIAPAVSGKWLYPSYDSMRIYFSTSDTLEYNTSYTITVPGAVGDNYGHTLGSDYTSTFTVVPFEVSSVTPSNASTGLSTTPQISVNFSGPVDTSTIRSGFSITPPVSGTFGFYPWSKTQFIFTPLSPLNFATTYTMTFSPSIRSTNGTPLASAYSTTFSTMPFEIMSVYPFDGATYVTPSQTIGINLSGPVDTSSVRAAFSISPSVAGSLSYYSGGYSITFTPTQGLKMGTTYTVTISSALRAQNGTHLPSPYTFSFSTPPFAVSFTNPPDGATNWQPYQTISVNFDTYIDTSTVRSAFSISPQVNGSVNVNSFYPTGLFTFTPSTPFALSTTYTVTVGGTLKALDGTPLGSPYRFSFTTVPFQVTGFVPSDGTVGAGRGTYLQVNFNAPIDTSTMRQAFSVSPAVTGTLSYQYYGSGNSSITYNPSSQLAANSYYTMTVSTALKSADGTPLSKSYSSTFMTGQY